VPVPAVEASLKDVLSDLEKLPAPSGVDDELFKKVKDAFSRAVALRAVERFVSKPPSGEAGKVVDLVPTDNRDGTYTLFWSYRNLGDYNQDRIVDIGDVSALAERLFEAVSPANEWIDGNSDGAIDLKDLDPLADAFFSEVSSYLIEVAGTDGQYSEFAVVPISDASEGASGGKFFAYTFTSEDANGYAFARVTPLDRTNSAGEASDSVGIAPPAVVLDVNPTFGDAPLSVAFDASASYDPDGGTITKYEWDLDGDGAYEVASATASATSHDYENAGEFSPILRITDDEGFAFTTSSSVSVYFPEWIHTWVKAYSGGDAVSASAESVALDSQGNVYSVGSVCFPADDPLADFYCDGLLLRYDAGGNLAWAKRWGGHKDEITGGGGEEFFHAVVVDEEGNVYAAGQTNSFWGTDSYAPCEAVVKLNSNGEILWQKVLGVPESELHPGNMVAVDIELDSMGNPIIAGRASGFSELDNGDAFVMKLDSAGNMLWIRSWGAPYVTEDYVRVEVDGLNNIYLGGLTEQVNGDFAIFLLKHDPDGNLLMQNTWDVPESGEIWSDFTFGPGGKLYVAGMIAGSATAQIDVLVLCFDSELNNLWGKVWGTPADDWANAICVDRSGNVFVAGDAVRVPNSDQKAFLVKFTGDGTLLWAKTWGDAGWFSSFQKLTMTPQGKLIITGTARNAFDPVWEDSDGTATDVAGDFGVPTFARESYLQDALVELVSDADFGLMDSVLDIGGGHKSALIMKLDPKSLP